MTVRHAFAAIVAAFAAAMPLAALAQGELVVYCNVQEAGGYTNDFFAGEGLTNGNPVIGTNRALCAKLADLIGIPVED